MPMNKKTFVVVMLASAVMLSTGFFSVQPVHADPIPLPTLPPPIYILSDGSVSPASSPILRVGDTYTFTSNINNTVEVQCANIVIDGNGSTITTPFTAPEVNSEGLLTPIGWCPGVDVNGENNLTIEDTEFQGCVTGVSVENSSDVTISQNTIQSALVGIAIFSSSNINIIGNSIALPNYELVCAIDGLPETPEASSPVQITIEGNIITGSGNVVLTSPPPQPQQEGLWVGVSDSEIIGNTITEVRGSALYFTGSNNLVTDNIFENSYHGVFFTGDSDLSVNNSIFYNDFSYNDENALVPWITDQPLNFWDNGKVGNYWSDYNGTEIDSSGIGGTPYVIAPNNVDNYPLVNPLNTVISPTPSPSPSPTASPFPSPTTSALQTPESTPTPTLTPSPSIPEFPSWIALPIVATTTFLTVLLIRRRNALSRGSLHVHEAKKIALGQMAG
jgi:parallel beta-helix repeat protein